MTTEATRKRIRSFLSKYLRETDMDDESDLFVSGRLNSLFAMELVIFVENQFEIILENEDLDLDNFRSVQAITRFIERKRDK
jgi:acyl carrier protein